MNLLAAFRRPAERAVPARRARPVPDWVAACTDAPAAAEDDEATAAPQSWYESSWVLRSGVSVTELVAAEPLADRSSP